MQYEWKVGLKQVRFVIALCTEAKQSCLPHNFTSAAVHCG